jgi:60 kDa SS-A/Ro ribonucleoprotein
MRTNLAVKHPDQFTAEGAVAARITPEQELRRTISACLLWEDGFYESGESVGDRIKALVPKCRPEFVAACAFEARTKMKLRHAPLLLVREMARCVPHSKLVGKLLADVIQRADELAEFLAIYWKDGPQQPLSKQVKTGLAAAFGKFNEYQLAKYNRDGAVKLRDVLFLCHAKPKDAEQEALWKRLIDGKLTTPDTWEVALSAGEDKKLTFERLMAEGQLGALAFLRNLRNMREAGVSEDLIVGYASTVDITRVLPFRFIAAARAVPAWEHVLEPMMLRACEGREKLSGRTLVMLDVSGSMDAPISGKSDLQRIDAACGVAILLRELCEDVAILTFSNSVVQVPGRRGFALRDAIVASQQHGGTYLGRAVEAVNRDVSYDRLIVLTDEQSADQVPTPKGKGYVINVASNKNGVGYGPWMHVDGWSEAVIDYLQELETQQAQA